MARASRAGFPLATQNLPGLVSLASEALVSKIAALCRTKVFFENSCEWTARLAQQVFGRQVVHKDLVTILGQLDPKLVKMARHGERTEEVVLKQLAFGLCESSGQKEQTI